MHTTQDRHTPNYPRIRVPFEYEGAPSFAGAIELAAVLALGQRGLIVSPARCGASTLLRLTAKALLAYRPSIDLKVLLVDQSVEGELEWRHELPNVTYFVSSAEAADPQQQIERLELVMADARTAMLGSDTVVLIDSFSALARALLAVRKTSEYEVIQELRGYFGLARATDNSLTIIGTLLSKSAQSIDELVLHELVATGNVEWRLSDEIMRAGLFPPIDIIGSGARRTELIIGDKMADRYADMRSIIDQQGPLSGLDQLLGKLRDHRSLMAVIDSTVRPSAPSET